MYFECPVFFNVGSISQRLTSLGDTFYASSRSDSTFKNMLSRRFFSEDFVRVTETEILLKYVNENKKIILHDETSLCYRKSVFRIFFNQLCSFICAFTCSSIVCSHIIYLTDELIHRLFTSLRKPPRSWSYPISFFTSRNQPFISRTTSVTTSSHRLSPRVPYHLVLKLNPALHSGLHLDHYLDHHLGHRVRGVERKWASKVVREVKSSDGQADERARQGW